jgi:site-specific recombinase XerC
MKDIQEWLGHKSIITTSEIYAHIDFKRKKTMADGLDNVFGLISV